MDRNTFPLLRVCLFFASLSARRAWIEIDEMSGATYRILVALRKESVDRNVDPDADTLTDDGRSPQGERG